MSRLIDGGHDVTVFAAGRGQATFRGARMFWASRMTPVSAVREAMTLSRPDVCHLIDPHRLGLKVAEAADRLGVPTVVLDPRRWKPGVDLDHHHPGLRDREPPRPLGAGALPRRRTGWWSATSGRSTARRCSTASRRRRRLPGVRLVVLGDGPGAEVLRDGRRQGDPARRPGSERARCLATFDVLVQPRKKEVYAPTVHEALASGVPVVAFDGGTAADVVRHEHNGLLVDTDRGGKAFARAVARLGGQPRPAASRWPQRAGLRRAPDLGRRGGRAARACTTPPRSADPPPRSAEPSLRPRCARRCPCCACRSCCRATPAGRTCGRPRAPSSG